MPWNQDSPMNQRIRLIGDWLSGDYTKSQLAHRYSVSRPTIDKWISRYAAGGAAALSDASRRPHNSPNKTSDELLARIVAMKEAHDKWGPKKLIELLRLEDPTIEWPSPSTAGQWLDRMGMVHKRGPKRRYGKSPAKMRDAN
ncbi:TPA: helix-turn-helix domain containing protein, partial [Pseudomonas putida]|nr:helix-turn-helix domain containing protein [Pseudomonas putida]